MSEGRALTNAIGNSVATLFIARWQGELDMERLQHVLHDPQTVDAEVERAMLGADDDDERATTGRFEREPEKTLITP